MSHNLVKRGKDGIWMSNTKKRAFTQTAEEATESRDSPKEDLPKTLSKAFFK
jgi:hypothetical protein